MKVVSILLASFIIIICQGCVSTNKTTTATHQTKILVIPLEEDLSDHSYTQQYLRMLAKFREYTPIAPMGGIPETSFRDWSDEDLETVKSTARQAGADLVTFGRVVQGKAFVGFLPSHGESQPRFYMLSMYEAEGRTVQLSRAFEEFETGKSVFESERVQVSSIRNARYKTLIATSYNAATGEDITKSIVERVNKTYGSVTRPSLNADSSSLLAALDEDDHEKAKALAKTWLQESNAQVLVYGVEINESMKIGCLSLADVEGDGKLILPRNYDFAEWEEQTAFVYKLGRTWAEYMEYTLDTISPSTADDKTYLAEICKMRNLYVQLDDGQQYEPLTRARFCFCIGQALAAQAREGHDEEYADVAIRWLTDAKTMYAANPGLVGGPKSARGH